MTTPTHVQRLSEEVNDRTVTETSSLLEQNKNQYYNTFFSSLSQKEKENQTERIPGTCESVRKTEMHLQANFDGHIKWRVHLATAAQAHCQDHNALQAQGSRFNLDHL